MLALLASLTVAASVPFEACVVDVDPNSRLLAKDPESWGAQCAPVPAGQPITRGSKHLFKVTNQGAMEVTWTGSVRGGTRAMVGTWEKDHFFWQPEAKVPEGGVAKVSLRTPAKSKAPFVYVAVFCLDCGAPGGPSTASFEVSSKGPPAPPSPPPPAPGSSFIQADLVRLREAPDESSPMVARLRLNTPVVVDEEQGDWAKLSPSVDFERCDAPDTPGCPVSGWALKSFIGPKKVARADLESQRGVAALERLVALDGTEAGQWKSLRDAYLAAGQKDKAKWVEGLLSGKSPVFLAACDGGKAVVVGKVTAKGLESVEDRSGAESQALVKELEGVGWYQAAGKARPLEGSPWPGPAARHETGLTNAVFLGGCDAPGALYATFPFAEAKSAAASKAERAFAGEAKKHARDQVELGPVRWFTAPFGPKLGLAMRSFQITFENGDQRGLWIAWSDGKKSTLLPVVLEENGG